MGKHTSQGTKFYKGTHPTQFLNANAQGLSDSVEEGSFLAKVGGWLRRKGPVCTMTKK